MAVGIDDVARPGALRQSSQIGRRRATVKLNTTLIRRERSRLPRQIGELVHDEVDHFPFPLDAPAHADQKTKIEQHTGVTL